MSLWKLVGVCVLVAIGSSSLTSLILNQIWHCAPPKDRMASSPQSIPSSASSSRWKRTRIYICIKFYNPRPRTGPLHVEYPTCTKLRLGENDTDEIEVLNEINRVIEMEREMVLKDMLDYPYPNGKYNINATKIEDLLIEKNGKPVRSIIFASWRSGSNFLTTTIGQGPGNFRYYEPLLDLGLVKIRGPPLAEKALKRIRALLNCDYSNLQDDYIPHITSVKPFMIRRISYIWKQCNATYGSICHDHRHLSAMCKLFPFQLMKLVRPRLDVIQELLADEKLAVRLALLVRDPRGIVQSRKHVEFCQRGVDCTEPALLCADLVADYKSAAQLQMKYPNTFRVIRYEDLAADPYKEVEKLLTFFGREFHPKIVKFLDTHTKFDQGDAFNTHRDTKSTPYHWKMDLEFPEVEEIQRTCAAAMEHWGYLPAMNASHQKEFHPVTDFVLEIP